MNKTVTKSKVAQTVILKTQEVRRLFVMSSRLSDLAENILEGQGEYKQEFIRGLNASLRETREGKLTEINSLSELR